MARAYKCYYCKQKIIDEEPVIFEMGNKKKVKKRSHAKCRQRYLDRKEFFDTLKEILDVPTIGTKTTVMALDAICKKGYTYKIMTHAIKVKEKELQNNFDKGWPYLTAIIHNQLPFSKKEVEQYENNKNKQDKLINSNNYLIEDIDVEYKPKQNNNDISDLLD